MCFVALAVWLVPQADDRLGAIWARPDAALLVPFWWIALAVATVVAVVFAYFATTWLASIVLAPLNDRLSEKVERAVGNVPEAPFSWGRFAADVAQGVAHSLLNLVLFLLAMALVLPLNLLPGAGSIVATGAGIVISASFMSLEFTDWPQARRRYSYRTKWSLARRQWPSFLGLGLGLYVMMAVPILNLLLLPVAITAGTLLFCELEKNGQVPAANQQ
ncbi:MAG: CysZ protein [Bradymonadia bacterium]|jgi:CysZ protein